MPTSEIVHKQIEPQPILYIRRKVAPMELQALFTECFPRIFGYAMSNSAAIAGNPMARYIDVSQGNWTVDSIVPLSSQAEGEGEAGEIRSGFLHGGSIVTATHTGAYENLPETYAAVDSWIKENNLTGLGENWEWYVTDPGETPNPEEWKTEVFFPVSD